MNTKYGIDDEVFIKATVSEIWLKSKDPSSIHYTIKLSPDGSFIEVSENELYGGKEITDGE